MRFAVLVVLALSSSPVRADGFSIDSSMLPPIDMAVKRDEMLARLPILDSPDSKKAISSYRQTLERFNTIVIQGFRAQITARCEAANEFERKSNRSWADGNISKNQKRDIDEQIASERSRCSDRNRTTSPYFKLYDEIVEIYRSMADDSEEVLSACLSNDVCRDS